jgi:hypothetical protein
MSSPFQKSFSAKSPLSQAKQYVGAYENVNTEATHGSNESIVAAIEGIGKVAGGLVEQKMAKKDADKLEKKAKINKFKPEQEKTIGQKISSDMSSFEEDSVAGLTTSQKDFGLNKIPELKLSNREKKARGISF